MKKLNNVYEAPKIEMVELFTEGEIMSQFNSPTNNNLNLGSQP